MFSLEATWQAHGGYDRHSRRHINKMYDLVKQLELPILPLAVETLGFNLHPNVPKPRPDARIATDAGWVEHARSIPS